MCEIRLNVFISETGSLPEAHLPSTFEMGVFMGKNWKNGRTTVIWLFTVTERKPYTKHHYYNKATLKTTAFERENNICLTWGIPAEYR